MDQIVFCSMCGAFRDLKRQATPHGAPQGSGDRAAAATWVQCPHCNHSTDLTQLSGRLANRVEKVPLERTPLLHRLYNLSAASARSAAPRGSGSDAAMDGSDGDDAAGVPGDDAGDQAVIDERCPKCNHPQLAFRTAQLRGIDEGQTIFYTCLSATCRHAFTVHS